MASGEMSDLEGTNGCDLVEISWISVGGGRLRAVRCGVQMLEVMESRLMGSGEYPAIIDGLLCSLPLLLKKFQAQKGEFEKRYKARPHISPSSFTFTGGDLGTHSSGHFGVAHGEQSNNNNNKVCIKNKKHIE